MVLEEERGKRRKSWQLGVSALEEQQQLLQEAQKNASEVLSETDTCTFIHRYKHNLSHFLLSDSYSALQKDFYF